jgi:hypothetical protein
MMRHLYGEMEKGRKPMSETITFNLPGWPPLILAPDRVQYGSKEIQASGAQGNPALERAVRRLTEWREILASDVQWIRLWAWTTKLKYGGATVKTLESKAYLEIGNPDTRIQIHLQDEGSAKTNTQLLGEIYPVVLRYYGPWILRLIIGAMARGETLNIGKFRLSTSGVEMPATKWLFFSGTPQIVPWERVKSSSTGLGVQLADSAHANVHGDENYHVPNACILEALIRYLSAPRYVTRDGKQKMGPFLWTQLLQMASGGMLQPADMVMEEGAEKWSPASAISGLFPTTAPAAKLRGWGFRPKVGEYFKCEGLGSSGEHWNYGKCTKFNSKMLGGELVALIYGSDPYPQGHTTCLPETDTFVVLSEAEFERFRLTPFIVFFRYPPNDGKVQFAHSLTRWDPRCRSTYEKEVGHPGDLCRHDGDHFLNAAIAWPTPTSFEVTVDFDSKRSKRGLRLGSISVFADVSVTRDDKAVRLLADETELPEGKYRVVIKGNCP